MHYGKQTTLFCSVLCRYASGMHTSILRPSTTVPWSRSRARSASVLLANVTKPNPYMQDRQNMHYQPAVTIPVMRHQNNIKIKPKPSPKHFFFTFPSGDDFVCQHNRRISAIKNCHKDTEPLFHQIEKLLLSMN